MKSKLTHYYNYFRKSNKYLYYDENLWINKWDYPVWFLEFQYNIPFTWKMTTALTKSAGT